MVKYFYAMLMSLVLASQVWAQDAAEHEAQAEQAARVWLELLDNGEYLQSWQDSAEIFRNNIMPQQWQNFMGSVRGKLGALKQRELQSASYSTTLEGVTEQGDYVVVIYDTAFAERAKVQEAVTLLKVDGNWVVGGFYME